MRMIESIGALKMEGFPEVVSATIRQLNLELTDQVASDPTQRDKIITSIFKQAFLPYTSKKLGETEAEKEIRLKKKSQLYRRFSLIFHSDRMDDTRMDDSTLSLVSKLRQHNCQNDPFHILDRYKEKTLIQNAMASSDYWSDTRILFVITLLEKQLRYPKW